MEDLPRQKLIEIVGRYGPELAEDSKRCEGLLKDLCGGYKAEIAVLVGAIREGITAELKESKGRVPQHVLLERCSQRLRVHTAVMASYARWGVESWALALGVVSEKDIANPFQCPSCGKSGNSRKAIAGRIVRCPNCNVRLKVSDNGLQFGVVTEGKSEKSELADALVDEKGNGKRIYLSTDLSDEPSELLRQRLRQAMAEGFITKDDTVILRKLRESLGVSQEHAQSLFDEVVGELNQLFPPTDMRPKAVTPFLDDPLDSTNQTAKAAEPSQTVTRVEIPMDPYGRVLCFLNLFLVFSVLVIRIFAVGLSFWTFCSTFLLWVLSSGAGIEILKTENRKRAKYLSAPMLMLGLPLLVIVSTFAGKESVLFGGLFFWFEFVTVFILSLLLAGASNPK